MNDRERFSLAAVLCFGSVPLLLVALALLLSGCDSRERLVGSYAVPDQMAPEEFRVRVVWHPHIDSVRAAAGAMGERMDVEGVSLMTTNPGGRPGYDCEIHLVYPEDLMAPTQELIGHEFAHCLFGRYHK